MYTFPELIKKIREEASITQQDFANKIGVSPILISMVETGQKPVSKKLLEKIAIALKVHPASITPFLFLDKKLSAYKMNMTEKKIIEQIEKLQIRLIREKSKLLK